MPPVMNTTLPANSIWISSPSAGHTACHDPLQNPARFSTFISAIAAAAPILSAVNAYVWGILISIAVYFGVGYYAGRRVQHLDDYFVAGRRAPTLLIVGTLVASLMSTTAFLGEAGQAYSGYGSLLLILVSISVTGYVGGALFFGRHLRRSRALTVAEYFGQRFASQRVQGVAGITVIAGLGAYLMVVTQGAALIITEIADMEFAWALVIVWLGYTIFTLYSGSQGVVITDTIMFLLFSIVSFLAMAYIVDAGGGWYATVEQLAHFEPKPDVISWHGMTGPNATWSTPTEGLAWAVILGVAWSVVVAVSPWQASRYLMAKNEHTVIRAGCGAGLAIVVLYSVLGFSSAAINLSNPGIEPSEGAMIWAALNIMPTFAGVLLMAGIVAAALSSATTFLSLVGFSVANDIVSHRSVDERRLLRWSRFSMLGIGLLTLLLAYLVPPRIFWITYFVATVFASSWGPVAFMSVWSRRITADGAFWGIVVGFAGNVVPKALVLWEVISLPVWADPIILGGLLSIVSIVWVSRRGVVTPEEKTYRLKLHEVAREERDAREVQRTLLWSWLLVGCGVLVSTAMIIFYAKPYADAMGRSEAGLASGEVWLSLGVGLVLVVNGLLVRWHMGRWTAE